MDNTTCVTQLNFFAVLLCARGTALKIATFVIWCGKKAIKKNNQKQNKIPQQEKKNSAVLNTDSRKNTEKKTFSTG